MMICAFGRISGVGVSPVRHRGKVGRYVGSAQTQIIIIVVVGPNSTRIIIIVEEGVS